MHAAVNLRAQQRSVRPLERRVQVAPTAGAVHTALACRTRKPVTSAEAQKLDLRQCLCTTAEIVRKSEQLTTMLYATGGQELVSKLPRESSPLLNGRDEDPVRRPELLGPG